jgi:hypothetical protein
LATALWPSTSGQDVYEAFINSTRGVPPSISRARNLSSGVFVIWQRYGCIQDPAYRFPRTPFFYELE